MSLSWDVGESPAMPPADPLPDRRRVVLLALSGLVLLAIVGSVIVSWQRRQRLAEAERAVRAAAEIEQRALAAQDPDLLAPIVALGVSQPQRDRLVRDPQVSAPGLTIIGGRGIPEAVRFRSSRTGALLDRAEVDVRTVVSDALTSGEVLRRRTFAQTHDGQWRLRLATDPVRVDTPRTKWVGTVLSTTVLAADEALGRDLHAVLDADLADFCTATRAAGRTTRSDPCTFQLLSEGLPITVDPLGKLKGVAIHLPAPPGSLVPGDEAGRGLLRRAYLREMIAQWQGRDRALVIETLLDAWLAPADAAAAPLDAQGDWAQLEADLGWSQGNNGEELTSLIEQRLVHNLRVLAADVVRAGGRQALLALMLAWPPDSAASWLAAGLADNKAVLANWRNAPPVIPVERALVAICPGGTLDRHALTLFVPGQFEGRAIGNEVCPFDTVAASARWRPGSHQLAVLCYGGFTDATTSADFRLFELSLDGSLRPTGPSWPVDDLLDANAWAWSPDGQRLVAGRRDGGLQVWQLPDGRASDWMQPPATIPAGSRFDAPMWSADGKRLSLSLTDENGTLGTVLRDPVDGRIIGELDLTADAWSPTGALLAAHGVWQDDALPLVLVDGSSGQELRRATIPLDRPSNLVAWPSINLLPIGWSPDGRWIAMLASGQRTTTRSGQQPATAVIAWRPEDGATRTTVLPEIIRRGAWSRDSRHVVLAEQPLAEGGDADPPHAWLWSPETGETAPSDVPPLQWSLNGRWGVATLGSKLSFWPAGADRPSWSSDRYGCGDVDWQPELGAGPTSPAP